MPRHAALTRESKRRRDRPASGRLSRKNTGRLDESAARRATHRRRRPRFAQGTSHVVSDSYSLQSV